MDSYTVSEVTSISFGRPVTISRPYTFTDPSTWGTAQASFFLIPSAVLSPMYRLYFLFTVFLIASSSLLPPTGINLLNTIPPRERMEISVVSAPISTTMTPFAVMTSRPAPTASATGFSTILIWPTFKLELIINS